MIDPLTLRSQLLALLGSHLGTYADDGGNSTAIAILPDLDAGYNHPSAGTKCTGIEAIINCPAPEIKPLLGGDRMKLYRWQIILKQWDSTKDLLAAIETLVNGLTYNITKIVPSPPNPALGIIEQVRIEIVEYVYQETV